MREHPDLIKKYLGSVVPAADTHLGHVFLGFSRLPAARTAVDPHGVTTVRWTDMRFAGGTFSLDQQGPRTNPFTATVRIGIDGKVTEQFLGANR